MSIASTTAVAVGATSTWVGMFFRTALALLLLFSLLIFDDDDFDESVL